MKAHESTLWDHRGAFLAPWVDKTDQATQNDERIITSDGVWTTFDEVRQLTEDLANDESV